MFLLNLWERLRGPRNEFALEERILNAGGILSVATLLIFTAYNLLVVILPELAWITAVTLLLQLFLYYQSRVKKNFSIARYGFTVVSYIFLAVNYYYGAGINGPVLFSFFLSLIIIIFIHRKQSYIYLFLHLATVAALLFLEYRYGVDPVYTSKSERFVDVFLIFCIILSLTYILVRGVVKSYNRERRLASDRAQALALLHQENNRLFSIISHDLRAPLSSIQGYLELLGSQSLSRTERFMLEGQLLELTNGTAEFLTNLLAWSKSQLEGTKVQLSEIRLSPLLEGVLTSVRPIAAKKEVTIETELKADILVADIEMTRIVLRNLLTNAIKYSRPGDKVLVQSWYEEGRLVLSVQDFGVGIALEKQHLIFQHQAGSELGTANEPGVGLGLVLCAEFISLQAGKIWFHSGIEEGTTFFVSFSLTK